MLFGYVVQEKYIVMWGIYQKSHPIAKPTPRSRNLRGNSIIGALTGMRAVISPNEDIIADMMMPISPYASTEPPGPACAKVIPLPRNNPDQWLADCSLSMRAWNGDIIPFPMVL
jgi:hypothetical protein